MDGLKKLIEQQHQFSAFKTEKALQLSEHVLALKKLIVSNFLDSCPDLQYDDQIDNILEFSFQELKVSIEIINPITKDASEDHYNLSERARKKLTIKVFIQRKMDAVEEYYLIDDLTQYRKSGEYTYKVFDNIDTNFMKIIDLCFINSLGLKVQFHEKDDLPF